MRGEPGADGTSAAARRTATGEETPSPGLVLTLFVADRTPSSVRAQRQVTTWLERRGGRGVTCEVVNVHERPDLAERERVLATPTLLRHSPLPRRKLVGDLADWEAVLRELDLAEEPAG